MSDISDQPFDDKTAVCEAGIDAVVAAMEERDMKVKNIVFIVELDDAIAMGMNHIESPEEVANLLLFQGKALYRIVGKEIAIIPKVGQG